jgi:short-subunit dehydrogenase
VQQNKSEHSEKLAMKFAGKTVVITGASPGIGRQTAIDFARNGASSVALVSRSESKLLPVAGEISRVSPKCRVFQYPCDVSDKHQVMEMGRQVLAQIGHVDVLVNNAGFGIFKKVSETTIEEMESVNNTNYCGMLYCTKAFIASMLEKRSGHIVNVASVAGSFGVAGLAAYCGSKFAMLGFSESLYHELKGTGVGITVVSPIGVKTNFFAHESFSGGMPNYTGFALSPQAVSRAVLRAANSPRLEIIVPFYMRAAVWLKHTLPYVVQPITGAISRRGLR